MRKSNVGLALAIAAIALFGNSCHRAASPATTPAPIAAPAIVSSKTSARYAVRIVPRTDHQFEKAEPPALVPATPGGASTADDFSGSDRAAAKTSLSSSPVQSFADVAALLKSSLFVKDSKMLSRKPAISKAKTSGRVSEEQHNVTITGFLYASTLEPDNDFHCIIGVAPGTPVSFVNVELSGLPASGQFRAPLLAARNEFKTFFGAHLPGSSGYHEFDPPIPVRITGSIFFDVDHKAGVVGPEGKRPTTAWEIHPVSKIEFEPN